MDEEGKVTPLWRMTICGEGQKKGSRVRTYDEKKMRKSFFSGTGCFNRMPEIRINKCFGT